MFNEDVRKAIYGVVAAIMSLLVVVRAIDSETAEQLADAVPPLLSALTALLAWRNTPRGRHAAED